MKKRIVAVMLSITLCMATVLQAGAADFSDQAASGVSAVFGDSFEEPQDVSEPEQAAPLAETVPEVTPTPVPEVFGTVTPSPDDTQETPVPENPVENPEETQDPGVTTVPEETPVPEKPDGDDAQEEETPDMDIFTAGEDGIEPADAAAVPNVSKEELLAAPEGRIYIANWRRQTDGRWKLAKPAVTQKEEEVQPVDMMEASQEAGNAVFSEDVFGTEDSVDPVSGENTADAEPEAAVTDPDISAGQDILTQQETAVSEDTSVQQEVTVSEDASVQQETAVQEDAPAQQDASIPEDDSAQLDILSQESPSDEEVLPEADLLGAESSTEYYTKADGIVHIATYQSVGQPDKLITEGDYYFDEEGYMVTGQSTIPANTPGFPYETDKEAYFMPKDQATLNNPNTNIEPTPANSDLGKMQKKYWLWTGKAFRYYSSNGGFLSMSTLKKTQTEQKTYTGCYTINGQKYILDKNGVPRVGHIKIKDGNAPGWYYGQAAEKAGDIPGSLVCNSWIKLKDAKGVVLWRKYLKDGRYLSRGIVATKLDKKIDPSVKDYTYLLSASGYIIKGKMKKAANGYYYITDKYGRIYKSKLVTYGKSRYYVGSNGRRVSWTNSWHRIASKGNRYYYFGKTPGKVQEKKGWQKVIKTNGKSAGWYYFSSKGNHYVDKLVSGRYFRPDGRLASGIVTVKGKTYFFQGSTSTEPKGQMYKNTWISYKKKWYYAGSNGVLYKNGWKKINDSYYYFNSDYTVKTNSSVVKDGKRGYVDSRGKFYSAGWVIVNNAQNLVKYVDPSTGTFAVNCSKVINGLKYYFDKNGYRINDLTGMYRGPYYLVADRVNGVMTVYDSSRTVPVKSIRISVGLPGTPTWPTNRDMRLTSYSRWQPLMGPSWGQYGTHVDGAGNGGIFVHSVAGSTRSYYNVSPAAYNMLGNPASHGCIRCCVADARWVFYNCNGSTIRIIDGTYNANEAFKGPLGRRALVPMYGSYNFDPTDNLAWH